ncbi:MAG: ABC transporter substrate-binding protein, partial [Clostridiales bacterium]|nr:ABC transporter substrate-binding protein [Clostridiales bacterium]
MMKRFTLLLISLVLVAAMAGCTSVPPAISDSGEDSRILLDWYINFSWYSASFGNNAVSRALTDKTGVDIRFVSPEGNESVTLNTLIAGDMLPDLVTLGWWEP